MRHALRWPLVVGTTTSAAWTGLGFFIPASASVFSYVAEDAGPDGFFTCVMRTGPRRRLSAAFATASPALIDGAPGFAVDGEGSPPTMTIRPCLSSTNRSDEPKTSRPDWTCR